jgi:hypothetical protein
MRSKWDQCTLGADCGAVYSALSLRRFSCPATAGWRRGCSVDHLVVFVRLAAHGLFISSSLEWTSPVDQLWKHLNPPSTDYIETNLVKD